MTVWPGAGPAVAAGAERRGRGLGIEDRARGLDRRLLERVGRPDDRGRGLEHVGGELAEEAAATDVDSASRWRGVRQIGRLGRPGQVAPRAASSGRSVRSSWASSAIVPLSTG